MPTYRNRHYPYAAGTAAQVPANHAAARAARVGQGPVLRGPAWPGPVLRGPAWRDLVRSSAARPSAARPATARQLPLNVVELYPGASDPRNRRRKARLRGSEGGMATAEYAIATLAAVSFAGLLVFILRSEEVRGFLLNLIRTALALP